MEIYKFLPSYPDDNRLRGSTSDLIYNLSTDTRYCFYKSRRVDNHDVKNNFLGSILISLRVFAIIGTFLKR